MPLPPLYSDVSTNGPLIAALVRQGVDVLRAQDDGMDGIADVGILDRATALRPLVFSQDIDFPIIAEGRLAAGIPFCSIIYLRQNRLSIPEAVFQIMLILDASTEEEFENTIHRLPIK